MLRYLGTGLALALATACDDGPLSPAETGALETAEERWEAAALDDYTFEYATSSAWGFAGWRRITVRGGLVTAVVYADSTDVPVEGLGWPTVDSLFTRIHALQTAPSPNLEDADVEFDETLGYPTRIDYTYDRDLQDAGATYLARNLTPSSD